MSRMGLLFLFFTLVIMLQYSAGLSPVILIPGNGGSQLEARLNKTEVVNELCDTKESYVNLWLNPLKIFPLGLFDCFVDNLRLIYDSVTRTTRSPPGVEIRVPGWGTTETVEWLDPKHIFPKEGYFNTIADALVNIGYIRDTSIRGAPYDFRKTPTENVDFFVKLKTLVEETYTINNNSAITLVTHSMGGSMAQHFLKHQTQKWKDQYIKRFIAMATPWGGTMETLKAYALGENLGIPLLSEDAMRALLITFPSLAWMLPSDRFWKPTEALLQDPNFNYTINDLQKLFIDLKIPNAWDMRQDLEVLGDNFTAPGVEVHCLYGTGVPTGERLVYERSWFKSKLTFLKTDDGDGTVNIRSLTGCEHWQSHRDSSTPNKGHSVLTLPFPNVKHRDMMHDQRVIDYIITVLTSG